MRSITIVALAAMLLAACAAPAVSPAPLDVGASVAAVAPALSGGSGDYGAGGSAALRRSRFLPAAPSRFVTNA